MTEEQYQRRQKRYEQEVKRSMRRAKLRKALGYFYLIVALFLLIALVLSVRDICMMQEDAMNQIMEIRQEMSNETATETVTETENVVPADPPLTPEARELVERVVAAEARGDTFEGMVAVAQVIYDRAELWGMTPAEVVTAKGQFATPYTGEISTEVKEAVSMVFDGGARAVEEPVTHFHSCEVDPYWTEGKINRGSLGSRSHQFYY